MFSLSAEQVPGAWVGAWLNLRPKRPAGRSVNGSGGFWPQGTLIQDAGGNLYGTTIANAGVVFELSPASGPWTQTVLHSFSGSFSDGGSPSSNVIFDSSGNLYGTTQSGVVDGIVFELTP